MGAVYYQVLTICPHKWQSICLHQSGFCLCPLHCEKISYLQDNYSTRLEIFTRGNKNNIIFLVWLIPKRKPKNCVYKRNSNTAILLWSYHFITNHCWTQLTSSKTQISTLLHMFSTDFSLSTLPNWEKILYVFCSVSNFLVPTLWHLSFEFCTLK